MKLLALFFLVLSLSATARADGTLTVSCNYTTDARHEILRLALVNRTLGELVLHEGHVGVGIPYAFGKLAGNGAADDLVISLKPTDGGAILGISKDPRVFHYDGDIVAVLSRKGVVVKEIPATATIDVFREIIEAGLGSSDTMNAKASLRIGSPGSYQYFDLEAKVESGICRSSN